MGNLLSGGKNSPFRILMLGLDAVGKTTLLHQWKENQYVRTVPTQFTEEAVTLIPGVTFAVWDVGGHEKLRPLWKHYFIGTEGIVFVIDSDDNERVVEARDELHKVITDPQMPRGVPIVVVANKQDIPGSLSPSKLIEVLDLQKLRDNPWHIQGTSTRNGDQLYEVATELAKMVKQYRKDQGVKK